MSAVSAPFGFRAAYHPSGQVRPKAYTIASAYAANIFNGDPVKLVTDGTIQLATSDGTRTGTTDGIRMLGVFVGVEYKDSLGKYVVSPFWPTGVTATEIVAYVHDDPETLYEVEVTNPSPGTSAQPLVGAEFDWVPTAPGGSTSTGLSSTKLTVEQATSGQFQITGFGKAITDSLTDAFMVAQVRINEHHYKASVVTI